MKMLDVKGLNISFALDSSSINICSDVSFSLAQGKVLGLIGESGSGKTITCKAILDLLPENAEVEAKEISFKGQNLLGLNQKEFDAMRGTAMAMIFQDPVGSFNPVKTIGWHFLHAGKRRNLKQYGRGRIFDDAEAALKEVEIANPREALKKYPHQLSGGMLQRCLIALVLFLKPSLIVADEPTTNLDNLVERQIVDIFDKLRNKIDASFIFITHDMTIAEQISDEIAVMYAGQIVEHGNTADIIDNPHHPYTRALINTARELESDVDVLTEISGDITSGLGVHDKCRFGPRCPLHSAECDKPIELRNIGNHGQVRCIKAESFEGHV
ncbi:ABC transporter ATP-binding protein [Halomonas sp. ATCH28]|uniref:Nickel import system ATP-binding protein NikD n=1 Tax=Halomonas gemina TaxID=2945105 RepID=A0ABT0T3X8_9GAMM|nr:ABC transporter ATP-binding protein [Halomonas gemina]MCL7941522.1 ABC transporter ATP-binding protein [Halomonas gemina]